MGGDPRGPEIVELIQLGEASMVLTGGMESMSQAPHVIRGLRSGLRLGQGKLEDSLWEALIDTHCGCAMKIISSSECGTTTPTRSSSAGSFSEILAASWGSMCLGLLAWNTNPIALAPASTAISASSRFVMPQIFTQVIIAFAGS